MILGIAGSFGAGKGAFVDFLLDKKNFAHYSASGFITEEIIRRNMPVDRDSMILVSNDLRATYGPSYIVESLYKRAQEHKGSVVIESLRAVAEVQKIKELGGYVIGIDANPELRYKRAFARGSEKDNVTYEKWLSQEQQEMNADDPTKQNIFGALKESNVIIQNNGSLEELHVQIEAVLKQIAAKK